MKDHDSRSRDAVSRRSFIKGVGAGGLGGAVIPGAIAAAEAAGASQAGALVGPGAVAVTLRVNGEPLNVQVEPRDTLLDVLRQGKRGDEYLDTTGGKRVCDRASCGACSMILDGKLVYGCTVLALEAQGQEIRTVEGVGSPGAMSEVQQAFVEHDALMCGFCTPGMVVAATSLLEANLSPSRDQIRSALDGNICRCGTYIRIFEATETAAARLRGN